MAQELTFNISEDRRNLQGPVEAKNFNLKFGTDGVAITHGNPKQWVQGRIGDDKLKQVFVNITEGEKDTPKDVAGMFLAFVGIIHDKDGRPHRVVDYKHSTTIDVEHGRFRFDFSDQAFTVAGEYQQAFFMLVKEGPGGGCVATMEFDMQVMANFVFTDLVPEDYITPFNDTVDQLLASCKKFKEDTAADEAKFKQELEDAYEKFQKDSTKQFSDFKDATDDDLAKFKSANAKDIANFKQQYSDAVKAKQDDLQKVVDNYTDKIDTMLKDLNQQGIDTTTLLTTLQTEMKDLQDKIKADGLFTKEEAQQFETQLDDKMQKTISDLQTSIGTINQKVEDSQSATQKKVDELGQTLKEQFDSKITSRGMNVNDYGAKADGTTDDTVAIQKAINAFAKSKSNKLVFSGTYNVSKTDVDADKRPYALKLAALSGKTIDLTNARFKTAMINDFPNIFAFYNCKDIYVLGGYAEAINFNMDKGHDLYSGAFIYAKSCTNLNVSRTSTFNMMYDVCIMDSQDGVISDNHFAHNLNEKNVHDYLPLSAIILYNGVNYHVTGNSIIGGLRDGDLSVFGGGSYGNIVSGNHLKALVYWSEGITVDGGACKTIVSNNLLSGGYNFAIDVKFNSENTLVANNTIEKCVVAISDRGGEIDPKAHVFETVIKNNNIIFGGLPVDTQNLGFFGYNQIGIDVENQFTSDINGNHFTLGKGYNANYKIVGVTLSQPNYSWDFLSPAAITNNFFEFKNGIDASYQIAGEGSVEVQIENTYSVNVSDNVFKGATDGITPIEIKGTNQTIKISDNYFMTNDIVPVQCNDMATYNHLIITNDNYCGDFNQITNAKKFQISTLRNHQSYLTQKVNFSENTTEMFLTIIAKWDGNTLIRVNGEFDYMGTFVLDGTYKIEIINGQANVHAVDTNNTDVELCATKISNNIYGLIARATRPTKGAKASNETQMNVYTEILDGENGTTFN